MKGVGGGGRLPSPPTVDHDGLRCASPVVTLTAGFDEKLNIGGRGTSVRSVVRETRAVCAAGFVALGRRVGRRFEAEAQAGQVHTRDVPANLASGLFLVYLSGPTVVWTTRVRMNR
jgi:hypothetical protein